MRRSGIYSANRSRFKKRSYREKRSTIQPERNSTYTAPVPPSRLGVELKASTSWCWRSQEFKRFFRTGASPLDPWPLPWMIRMQRICRSRHWVMKSLMALRATAVVMPCISSSSPMGNWPRLSRCSWRCCRPGRAKNRVSSEATVPISKPSEKPGPAGASSKSGRTRGRGEGRFWKRVTLS